MYSNQVPKAIPYITSYYDKISGFCMDQETYKSLKEDEYEVLINSEHFLGSMTIGECVLEGETKEEVLISYIYVIQVWEIMNFQVQLFLLSL